MRNIDKSPHNIAKSTYGGIAFFLLKDHACSNKYPLSNDQHAEAGNRDMIEPIVFKTPEPKECHFGSLLLTFWIYT